MWGCGEGTAALYFSSLRSDSAPNDSSLLPSECIIPIQSTGSTEVYHSRVRTDTPAVGFTVHYSRKTLSK